ncbi:MAG: 3'-5' exonuclease, partial [Lysobacterales bacterium]
AEADPDADPPRIEQARARCIAACADAIAASLAGPDAGRPGQLAVLVNRNQDVAALRRALARRGVPVAAQVQQSVFESRAADSLRILLAGLAEPGREDRLRAALLGPWFAWSVDRVATLANTDPAWSALLDQFERARLRWQQHGPAAALLPWLQEASAGLLAASAAAGDGERFLTDARHLLELLQGEFARRPGIAELLDWLDRGGEDDAQAGSDERLLRLESDGDRVRVLTLHNAKGLEFDRVWLPLLWTPAPGRRAASKTPAYVVCHKDGERVIDTGGADFAVHQQAEQADREAEATRLLYVGLTRARAQCTVFYPQRLATDTGSALTRLLLAIAAQHSQDDDLTATLHELAAPADSPFELSIDWPPAADRRALVPGPGSSSPATAALPEPRPFETLWSFTRLHQGAHAQALAGEAIGRDDERLPAAVEADPGGGLPDSELGLLADLAGPGFGSALHALFEQALANGAGVARIDNADIRRSLRRFGIDPLAPAALDAIGRLLDRCLSSELAPGLSLAALPSAARAAEWAFELPLTAVDKSRLEALLAAHGHAQPLAGGAWLAGALSGSADLVFEWQGRFYLVDYKSNWLGAKAGDYAADGLDRTMQEAGYTLQYLLYTVALQRYLRRRIGAGYDYAQHFGGVYYLFVRAFGLAPGLGRHFARPEAGLIDAIDQLFDGDAAGASA